MSERSALHPKHPLQLNTSGGNWACDGRYIFGCGLKLGKTGGVTRYTCTGGCDFDLCAECMKKSRLSQPPPGPAVGYAMPSHAGGPVPQVALNAAFADLPSLFAALSAGGGRPAVPVDTVRTPLHPHTLTKVGAKAGLDWACDLRDQPNGCNRGFGGATAGLPRFSCRPCNFDACEDCLKKVGAGAGSPPVAPNPEPAVLPHVATTSIAASHEAVRRRALIIGINYVGTSAELKGCVNDAKCMKLTLMTKFGFKESEIRMLIEEGPDRSFYPTKANILQGLAWLVEGVSEEQPSRLFLHYSGHGAQTRDTDGDEGDSSDEVLVPLDYQTAGLIVDDLINKTVVSPLPKGTMLHALVDACHSGTMLDLAHKYDGSAWASDGNPARKGTRGGRVVAFSGCLDHQTSADTNAFAKTKTTGAMTFCFTLALDALSKPTYGELLRAMRGMMSGNPNDVMRKALESGAGAAAYGVESGARSNTTVMTQAMLHECSYMQAHPNIANVPHFSQQPLMSASEAIDADTTPLSF